MFSREMLDQAAQALDLAKAKDIRIATAETCTAGLVSSCLTSVPGASRIFERGFILYHDFAKSTGLGVPEAISKQHGAVSAEVTKGLAEGALSHSTAGVAVAVTGYAGPGGGNRKESGRHCLCGFIAQRLRNVSRTTCFPGRPRYCANEGGGRGTICPCTSTHLAPSSSMGPDAAAVEKIPMSTCCCLHSGSRSSVVWRAWPEASPARSIIYS